MSTLNNKRDDFNFPISKFPFLCRSISSALAYEIYFSQLVCYTSAYCKYKDFVDREKLLPTKLFSRVIAKGSLCQQLKRSTRDILTSLIPTI